MSGLREAPPQRTPALATTNRKGRVYEHSTKEQIVRSRYRTRSTSAAEPMFPGGWRGSGKKPDRADSKGIATPCAPVVLAPGARNWQPNVFVKVTQHHDAAPEVRKDADRAAWPTGR